MSIVSDQAEQNVNGLSAEEQAKLAACVDPDGPNAPHTLPVTPQMEQAILCILWRRPEHHALIKWNYFANPSREQICKVMADYHSSYGGTPSDEWIKHKLGQAPEKQRNLFLAEWIAVKANFEPHIHGEKALLDLALGFARRQAMRLMFNKAETHFVKGDLAAMEQVVREFSPPSLTTANMLSNWTAVSLTADNQKEDWLIQDWSEFGCLTMFSSLPKLGKSTIVAELIACLMLGRPFYGMELNPAPVLLIDPENREKTLVRRIRHACGDDGEGKLGEWFFRLNAFAKPLDLNLVRKAIEDVKKKTGQPKVVVILDTLRSCYSGAIESENDNSEMVDVIVPLKDLATETDSAVMFIHHNSKGSDTYAGGTAILGCVDYYWNWVNNHSKRTGKLSCQGRGDYTDPITLRFDLETQRNVVMDAAEEDYKADDDRSAKYLISIPTEDPGVTADHLAEAWGVSLATAKRKVTVFVDAGKVLAETPANRKYGKVHYKQLVGNGNSLQSN